MNVFILYYTHTHTYIYTFIPFILFYFIYIYIFPEQKVKSLILYACVCKLGWSYIYLSIMQEWSIKLYFEMISEIWHYAVTDKNLGLIWLYTKYMVPSAFQFLGNCDTLTHNDISITVGGGIPGFLLVLFPPMTRRL